ncbi:MAG: hypothetical protein GY940_38455, partial [bacterium]|nr:hypothetical protein [bacterium]
MKKKKTKIKTTIRNHTRIINALLDIDEEAFKSLFVALYSYKPLREDFAQFVNAGAITEVSYPNISVLLIADLKEKKGKFKQLLDIIIKRIHRYLKKKKYHELSMDELEAEIKEDTAPSLYDTGLMPVIMLLYYLSVNIFEGEDFERIKKLYYLDRERWDKLGLKEKKTFEEGRLQFKLRDHLSGNILEVDLNGYCKESNLDEMEEDEYLEIAERFHCDFDPDANIFNRVHRGVLLFLFDKIE